MGILLVMAIELVVLPKAGIAASAKSLRPQQVDTRTVGTWTPPSGLVQIPIWPGAPPDAISDPPPEAFDSGGGVFNVNVPTMTLFQAKGHDTGVAMIVYPGGGYQALAMSGEGTQICDWLTSRGITCVLLKYRVPNSGPTMKNGHTFYPRVQTALQDAQRTMGLVRQRAIEWHIDARKLGVIGFSAGGHLAAAVSTHFDTRTYTAVDAADELSSRPDFALLIYPGHLWTPGTQLTLRSDIHVPADAPPTFLLQAEDDPVDPVKHSLTYYFALQQAGVPAEMHLYAQGGHAFALQASKLPISEWPVLAEKWLRTIGML